MRLNHLLLGAEQSALGISVDCAPVLDLRHPGAHEVIGDRAVGADPLLVADLGRAALGHRVQDVVHLRVRRGRGHQPDLFGGQGRLVPVLVERDLLHRLATKTGEITGLKVIGLTPLPPWCPALAPRP